MQGLPLISIDDDIISSGAWESCGVEDFTPHAPQTNTSETISLFHKLYIRQLTSYSQGKHTENGARDRPPPRHEKPDAKSPDNDNRADEPHIPRNYGAKMISGLWACGLQNRVDFVDNLAAPLDVTTRLPSHVVAQAVEVELV